MPDNERFACRELRPADLAAIERYVADGPRYETLLLGPLLQATRAQATTVWWYGALAGGTSLQAVMGIEGHAAVIHGRSEAALDAMAKEALHAQRTAMPAPAARHQLLGEARSLGRFWNIFKDLGRQVVLDRARPLFGAVPGMERPSQRATVAIATAADAKLVAELTAEYALEAYGVDPRRTARAAHERRTADVIAAGRQIVAREGPKPVLVAEIRSLDAATVLLEAVYVPKALRSLPKLVGGALVGATELALARGAEALFFAELETVAEAAAKAGFPERARYHAVAMLG